MDSELAFCQPWFQAIRLRWGADDLPSSQKTIRQKLFRACKGELSKPERKKEVLKLMKEGRIGGRQIKAFIDGEHRLILYSDTDERELSEEEKKQFSHFHFERLPRLSSRKHKMPLLRTYLIGLRFHPARPSFESPVTPSTPSCSSGETDSKIDNMKPLYHFPSHRHGLLLEAMPGHICDVCNRVASVQFRCGICNFDVCEACYISSLCKEVARLYPSPKDVIFRRRQLLKTKEKEEKKSNPQLPSSKAEMDEVVERMWEQRCQMKTICVKCNKCGHGYRTRCPCAKKEFQRAMTMDKIRQYLETAS